MKKTILFITVILALLCIFAAGQAEVLEPGATMECPDCHETMTLYDTNRSQCAWLCSNKKCTLSEVSIFHGTFCSDSQCPYCGQQGLGYHNYFGCVVDPQYLKEPATCSTYAFYWKCCTDCGKSAETDPNEKNAYFSEDRVDQSAQKDPDNHSELYTYADGLTASCTVDGRLSLAYCSGCSCPIYGSVTQPPCDFFDFAAGIITNWGSSVEYGLIPAKGHDLSGGLIPAVPSNCSAQGTKAHYVCGTCGAMIADDKVTVLDDDTKKLPPAPDGHDFSVEDPTAEGALYQPADCRYSAYYHKSCKRCGAVCTDHEPTDLFRSGDPDKNNHAGTVTEALAAQAPTCTADGWYAASKCSVCGAWFNTDQGLYMMIGAGSGWKTLAKIDALGHQMTLTPAVAATCVATGNNAYYTCGRCKGVFRDETGTAATTVEAETLAIDPDAHDPEDHEAQAPTCTAIGWDAYQTCKREGCAWTTYKEQEALGHQMTLTPAAAATCVAEGNNAYYTCGSCKGVFKDETGTTATTVGAETLAIDKDAHDPKDHEAQAPTCTAIGWDAYQTCSRCEYTTYTEKAALGHDYVDHKAQAPTCTAIGWDAYQTCKREGCTYTTYAELPALGHQMTLTPAVAATCVATGNNAYYTCRRCKGIFKDEAGTTATTVEAETLAIDPDAHDLEDHEAQAPTCTEIGWDAYQTCSRCEYTTYTEKAALGHDYVDHEAQAPTCTEIGWDAYQTCSRCEYTTYTEKAALDHDYVDHAAQAPTCTAIGWDAYQTCSRCDYTTYTEKAALGHDYVDHAAQTPTCTAIGWDAYQTCSRCEYTTYIEKEALGHDSEILPGKPATYTETGLTDGTVCARCGEILEEQDVIPVKSVDRLSVSVSADGKECACRPVVRVRKEGPELIAKASENIAEGTAIEIRISGAGICSLLREIGTDHLTVIDASGRVLCVIPAEKLDIPADAVLIIRVGDGNVRMFMEEDGVEKEI